MKIELRKLKISARRSGNTICYAAELWVDGKHAGAVGNHGNGDADYHHVDRATLAGVNAWLANNAEPRDEEIAFHDLTSWCAEQVDMRLEGIAA